MCWTTATNCNTPTMLHEDKHQNNASLLGMLLQGESHKIGSKFNDASSTTSKTEEEDDDDILLEPDMGETMEDVLMSSISLDDSSHLLNLDDVNDEASTVVPMNSTRHPSYQSLTSVVPPEETLFDANEQRYEWNDAFSMLKRLRRTRLSTVVEDDHAPMFQSTTQL
jgi:hypothetical protein